MILSKKNVTRLILMSNVYIFVHVYIISTTYLKRTDIIYLYILNTCKNILHIMKIKRTLLFN